MDALTLIQKLGSGTLVDRVYGALLGVSNEVIATGRKGTVTITLDVIHPQGADPLVVVVEETIKRTLPKSDAQGAMFYTVGDELHSRDPRQPELPAFRVVAEGQAELRSVDETDGALKEVE